MIEKLGLSEKYINEMLEGFGVEDSKIREAIALAIGENNNAILEQVSSLVIQNIGEIFKQGIMMQNKGLI